MQKEPEIILRDGRPAAVILDIDAFDQLLERLEDLEDLEALRKMRKRPMRFGNLTDFFARNQERGQRL